MSEMLLLLYVQESQLKLDYDYYGLSCYHIYDLCVIRGRLVECRYWIDYITKVLATNKEQEKRV